MPDVLMQVEVPIMTNSECQAMFYKAGHPKAIRESFMCAGYPNGERDSCEVSSSLLPSSSFVLHGSYPSRILGDTKKHLPVTNISCKRYKVKGTICVLQYDTKKSTWSEKI